MVTFSYGHFSYLKIFIIPNNLPQNIFKHSNVLKIKEVFIMINTLELQKESFVYKKRRRLERKIITRARRRSILSLIISLGLIAIASFFITHNIYISSNSKDLEFAVEYNFTTGFSSENKLLRVQKMSLIYCDGETSVVEAYGLSKSEPHKNTSIKGSFRKDNNKSWYLEKIFTQ